MFNFLKKVSQVRQMKSMQQVRYRGANRRATGLLPEPAGENGHRMAIDKFIDYRQLLIAIRANRQTCCIKFSSEKEKSRGALLVFQGRILGVIYGKKDLDGKLFDDDAYPYAIKDLSDPETEVVGHVLSAPLAVATASLFIGQFGISGELVVGHNAFSECYASLIDSKLPGCILVRDSDDLTVLAAYIYGSKMIGLYSGTDGWLEPTTKAARQTMSEIGQVKVTCTVLKVDNINEVAELTFPLSGLDGESESEEDASEGAEQASKSYSKISGSMRKKSKWLCIEQEVLARERFAEVILGRQG